MIQKWIERDYFTAWFKWLGGAALCGLLINSYFVPDTSLPEIIRPFGSGIRGITGLLSVISIFLHYLWTAIGMAIFITDHSPESHILSKYAGSIAFALSLLLSPAALVVSAGLVFALI